MCSADFTAAREYTREPLSVHFPECEELVTSGTEPWNREGNRLSRLIVGCGYVGSRLARLWQQQGQHVFVTSRSQEKAELFRNQGLDPILLDVTRDLEVELPKVETVVFCVGFDRSTGLSIHDVYVEGLRRVLAACPETVQQFIYLSSTGVFGESNGEWVNERSICKPIREGGRACLAAEQLLRGHPSVGTNATILRVAGIYGRDRLPQANALRQNKPLQGPDKFLNLIHVDDLVDIISMCTQSRCGPMTLCVSDGNPVKRNDFYGHLANLMGTAPPRFEQADDASPRNDRSRGSKRVRNDLLIQTLRPTLAFPSYREGLANIFSRD